MRRSNIGRQFEEDIAKRTGAKKIPGSGNGSEKEDLVDNTWLIQAKATEGRSITFKLGDWESVRYHAMQRGLNPRMEFLVGGKSFVLVETKVFDQIEW